MGARDGRRDVSGISQHELFYLLDMPSLGHYVIAIISYIITYEVEAARQGSLCILVSQLTRAFSGPLRGKIFQYYIDIDKYKV
jgi:hypothetical protein